MPEVKGKDFPYTPEGIAAAEAEAAAIDQATQDLPNQNTPADAAEMAAAEMPTVEAEVGEPLDEAIMAQLFEALFAEAFDPDDPEAVEMMAQIQSFLDANPQVSSAIASGEVTLDQFALMLRRSMGQPQEELV